jgi:endonuclease/exonuclease/phosphatase family metal-dependent hydrolase
MTTAGAAGPPLLDPPDSLPTVLVGDLPPTPGRVDPALIDGGFLDAWPAAAPAGEPGFTYPANAPRRRIDYVMVSRGVAIAEVSVPDDLGAAMSGLSDHRPLLVRLELPEPPRD